MAGKTSKGQKCRDVTARGCKVLKALFVPTIQSYFMCSGIIYICVGVSLALAETQIKSFLCDVAPERNETQDTGVGCSNCPAKLLLCGRGPCWNTIANITWDELAKSTDSRLHTIFETAAADEICNDVLESTDSPSKAVIEMERRSGSSSTDAPVSQACANFHCEVLLMAAIHPHVVLAPMSTETSGCSFAAYKRWWDVDTCVCAGEYQSMTAAEVAAVEAYCGFTFPTTTTTTTVTSTTVNFTTTTTTTAAGGGRLLLEEDCNSPVGLLSPSPSIPPVHRFPSGYMERRLQTSAPSPNPGVTNDDFPPWTVGDWSKCTCMQQCVSGIQTRSVQCLSAQCADPKEADKQFCTCGHCAECVIILNIEIMFYTFIVQGCVALVVFLSFVWLGSRAESSWVVVSWPLWFLGLFVKQLPPLVRLIMVVNAFQILIVFAQTWLLRSIQPDCNSSGTIKVWSIILMVVIILQFVMGMLTAEFKRMPAWVFRPKRQSKYLLVRLIGKLQRTLGP